MAKSLVLKALRIFGFEEMLKLSQAVQAKPALKKKAAGAELIVWDDAPEKAPSQPVEAKEADVLPFKKSSIKPTEIEQPIQDPHADQGTPGEEASNFYSSEFLLWQRELTKESGAPTKKEAVKGYSRSTEMYVVKTPSNDGKEKIRFASTNGVLVNKKQA